jgi:hypothetical protein
MLKHFPTLEDSMHYAGSFNQLLYERSRRTELAIKNIAEREV